MGLKLSLYATITSDECHAWFHLYGVSRATRSTQQAKIAEWKFLVYNGIRTHARKPRLSSHHLIRIASSRLIWLGNSKSIICVYVVRSIIELFLLKEWVSFFLGSWGMNRSTGQTNRVNREAVLDRFVCSALRFIPHEPRKKKTLIPYIYNASNQGPFLKFSEKNYKFKIPTVTGS